MKNCILCGKALDGENDCLYEFKKMCINCAFAEKKDDDKIVCANEDNLNAAHEKIMKAASDAAAGAFEINSLVIEALPLKKPLLKCAQWKLSEEAKEYMFSLFK